MPLSFASLNSGSNGNCYYIGNEKEAVLVDAGLSCRETERRLHLLGLTISNVQAIFISHEHTDHTKGAEVLSRKHGIPVYITPNTHSNCRLKFNPQLSRHFNAHEEIKIGGLIITPFPKNHDAADPHSFIISGEGVTIGVMTDIGSACEHVVKYFRKCAAVFLEANYDEQMLEAGDYPAHLKRRIRGENGHLSNRQALQIFQSFRSPRLSHLILSHLSENNNDPHLVQELFARNAGKVAVSVASRYGVAGVFTISG